MFDQEQDSSRCREIREIIRDIQSRRANIVEQERNKRSQMTQLRDELSEKRDRLDQLAKIENTPGLKMPIAEGMTTSANSVNLAIEAANLQNQIRVLESQLSLLEHDFSKLQDEMDRLLRSEEENAHELSRLNCVSP